MTTEVAAAATDLGARVLDNCTSFRWSDPLIDDSIGEHQVHTKHGMHQSGALELGAIDTGVDYR